MIYLAYIVALSLFALSGLHIFWGFGGRFGSLATLPKKADGTLLFRPGLAACIVVATGLGAMAGLTLAGQGIIPTPLTVSTLRKLHWAVAAIFTLRCIGDFRYVGFFRKERTTDFARMDRSFFTPLCALFAIAFVVLALKQ